MFEKQKINEEELVVSVYMNAQGLISDFSNNSKTDILSENSIKEVTNMNQKQKLGNPRTETCQYCKGTGYHQLLLGGSETCDHCGGSGRKHT